MKRNTLLLFVLALAFIGGNQLLAQPQQPSFQTFAQGFSEPLFVTHAFDDRIFVLEKAGRIQIMNQQAQRLATPFLDIDPRVNSASSERGLLGLAFHPDYKQNGYFYVNYTNSSGSTIVSRFSVTADSNIADPNSEVVLLTIPQPYSNHNGGCILFGPDGYLYIGMGDGGSGGDPGNRAQNGQELLGKILRIDVNGGQPYAIPADNPYVGSTAIQEEIWAFGIRNPWRFSFDRLTGDMWIGDVGQNQWEEIDFWPAGVVGAPNFGWRCYEGDVAYNTSGCQPQNTYDGPVFVYSHNEGCSVDGGYVYRGARFANLWGHYFHTDYCEAYLWWTKPNGVGGWTTTRSNSTLTTAAIVSFGEDYFGEVYLTGIQNGRIYRLSDTTCTPHAEIRSADSVTACMGSTWLTAFGGPSLTFQWQLGGTDITNSDSSAYLPTASGDYRVIVSNGSCADTSQTVHVTLVPSPTVSMSLADTMFCDFDGPVAPTLSPSGGLFSGPGVSAGLFDPVAAGLGTHTLQYSYTDTATGCSASAQVSVTVTTCVGLDNPLQRGFSIAPNPNAGIFGVQFHLGTPMEHDIEIVDISGRRLKAIHYPPATGAVHHILDLSSLTAGNYLVRLQAGTQQATARLVVQH